MDTGIRDYFIKLGMSIAQATALGSLQYPQDVWEDVEGQQVYRRNLGLLVSSGFTPVQAEEIHKFWGDGSPTADNLVKEGLWAMIAQAIVDY